MSWSFHFNPSESAECTIQDSKFVKVSLKRPVRKPVRNLILFFLFFAPANLRPTAVEVPQYSSLTWLSPPVHFQSCDLFTAFLVHPWRKCENVSQSTERFRPNKRSGSSFPYQFICFFISLQAHTTKHKQPKIRLICSFSLSNLIYLLRHSKTIIELILARTVGRITLSVTFVLKIEVHNYLE